MKQIEILIVNIKENDIFQLKMGRGIQECTK